MAAKRLRMFSGPNGSGKTTILNELKSEIPMGIVVNADEIEKDLLQSQFLSFDRFNLKIHNSQIQIFFKNSNFSPIKRNDPNLWQKLFVSEQNILKVNTEIDSYLAADLADFIRFSLVEEGVSFTFETVMSHNSKLEFIKKAKQDGYRFYLYFSATEDPLININRVKVRVSQNGHNVEDNKIRDRYYRSLSLLKEVIKLSDRAYIWDNSGSVAVLFTEITNGNSGKIFDDKEIPAWFSKFVLEKND